MTTQEIVQAIDQEIVKLQKARALLLESTTVTKRGPGRPRTAVASKSVSKRTLSAEARAKISAAQKARWVKAKKP